MGHCIRKMIELKDSETSWDLMNISTIHAKSTV